MIDHSAAPVEQLGSRNGAPPAPRTDGQAGDYLAVQQAPRLLVVDDEPGILDVIERFGKRAGFDVMACANGADALEELRRHPADVAMVDLRMPDVNGLQVLREIKAMVPGCDVILMTGFAAVDSAVEAIKLGARDYLTKPFDFRRLGALLTSIREEAERRRELIAVEGKVAEQLEFCGMIGRSPVMQETFSLIRRLAPHVADGSRHR